MFNKILAAAARPSECDESVLSAKRIARHYHAKLQILHVLESESSIYQNYIKHYISGEEIRCDDVYQEDVKKEILKNCDADLEALDALDVRIAVGFPRLEILRLAREENVDLIVLGAHTGKADTVGSTAEGVIRHERCPVMIVSKPILESQVSFNNVMVSIDFSPSCISAFKFAATLAQTRGSKLHLFHMLPIPPEPDYPQTQYEADVHKIRQRLQQEFCKEIPETIETQIDAWGGVYPDIEILKHARQNDIDLIAMGSHTKIKGKAQESRWYVGSAVERVSAKSVCPVVVVTDPKVLQKWEG
jgi:nucleotide-binding universal stress UspA family protein